MCVVNGGFILKFHHSYRFELCTNKIKIVDPLKHKAHKLFHSVDNEFKISFPNKYLNAKKLIFIFNLQHGDE